MDELLDGKLLLTVEEAATRLSIGRSFLYGMLRRGELPSVSLGRCRRVAARDLEQYVSKLTEQAHMDLAGWPLQTDFGGGKESRHLGPGRP